MRDRVVASLVVVAMCSASPASADPQKPIVVLESHVGDRPAEIVPLLAAIEDQLEARGFEARPAELMLLAGKTVARPGVLDPDLSAPLIVKNLTDGYSAFAHGDCDIAVPKLRKGLEEVNRNPQLLVTDTTNLDATFDAYVALGVCLYRAHDASYKDFFAELLRRFPLRPVSRQTASGAQGETLWVQAQNAAAAVAHGRLSISAGSADAPIFVFGQAHQTGHATLADIAPGTYSVFIWVRPNIGRQYRIDVASGEARLDVDPDFDAALFMRDWAGFQYPDADTAQRARCKDATTAATRWTDRRDSVVLATGVDPQRAAVDAIYCRDGHELRHARVYADAFKPEYAERLAIFLTNGTPGEGIEIVSADAAAVVKSESSAEHARSSFVLPESMIAVGGVAAIGGAVMVAAGGPPSNTHQQYYRDYRTPGFDVLGGGIALGVAGVLLLLHDRHAHNAPVVGVSRDAAILGWGGSF